MPHSLESKLTAIWPPAEWADVTVVAAVSGGADSVALLRALSALKSTGAGRLTAAHLNHQLRPEADEDERFVADLCGQLDVACEVERVDIARLAADSGEGIETAARHARYRFLEKTAGRLGARFVVTAHTADDQIETILHRILRGTGIRGLAGMARARRLGHATLMRPLLTIRRTELLDYLGSLNQPYRNDSSNLDLRFTRNRIRHGLLPRLQHDFNPDVVEAVLRLGALAGQSQEVIDGLVEEWFDRCVTMNDSTTAIVALQECCHPNMNTYLLRELLMTVWRRMRWPLGSMGASKWDELARLAASSEPTKQIFPGGIAVEVAEGEMRLSPIQPPAPSLK